MPSVGDVMESVPDDKRPLTKACPSGITILFDSSGPFEFLSGRLLHAVRTSGKIKNEI